MSYDGPNEASAVAAVTQLYRELFPPGGCILMSGQHSHLPPEISYQRIVGLGLDLEEPAANPRLDAFVVQNLNVAPRLPFDSSQRRTGRRSWCWIAPFSKAGTACSPSAQRPSNGRLNQPC